MNDLGEGDLIEQKLFIKESGHEYQKGTIRYNDFDITGLKIKFSKDLSTVFFSNKEQNLVLTLSTDKEQAVQKSMHHLEGKHSIQIVREGEKDFIVATAKP